MAGDERRSDGPADVTRKVRQAEDVVDLSDCFTPMYEMVLIGDEQEGEARCLKAPNEDQVSP